MSSPYYQYPQPQADPQFNATVPPPAAANGGGGYGYASAPPFSSDYPSSAPDYSGNSYYPPPPPPPSDQPPSYSLNPNPSSYSFPHLEQPAYYPPATGGTYDYPSSAANYNPPASSYESFTPTPPPVQNYGSAPVNGAGADFGGYGDQGMYGDGVYQYNGPKSEPYGARGSKSFGSSDSGVLFDDYGRPINVAGGKDQNQSSKGSGNFPKIVKAVPKVEEQYDAKGTVQKSRVKLLSEGYGQNDMDVLCQIGLDGIRILDPATNRTLRIYPLESVDRWEVLDSYIFAFWAKTSVDVEPRRIRLKSNSYTTSNVLDAVTAASIQVKEMGETSKPSDPSKSAEQQAEKKKAFADWMNIMKPGNVEKDHWVPDEAVTKCTACSSLFNAFNRRHHCRNCGDIFCDKCTQGRIALTADANAQSVRVCDQCMAEVTQRLSNAKEASTKPLGGQSHDELVRKLREEMDKNRKTSTGPTSDGSSTRMREVACPTCTVHLQVQVPASGSETIECSVCQQPFLVGAAY